MHEPTASSEDLKPAAADAEVVHVEEVPEKDEHEHEDAHQSGCCACMKHSKKKKITPVPWCVLMVLFFPLFMSCYSITYIFPYVPNMVLYYGHAEEDKGYYAGIIACSFFLGRIVGSYFWGWLSDRCGRKPIIIFVTILMSATNLTFGFMPNVWLAAMARVLVGLFNGMLPVIKAVIYEVSDDTNQAWCMSIISIGWGTGTIIGPLVSGYLAQPVDQYPDVFDSAGVFAKFPFLLPSLIATILGIPLVIPVIFCLPETSSRKAKVIHEIELKPENPEEQDTLLTGNKDPPEAPDKRHHGNPTQRHSVLLVPHRPKLQRSASDSDPGTDELSPLPWPDESDICYIDSAFKDEYSRMYGYGLVPGSHGSLYDIDLYPTMANKRKSWRISFTGSLNKSRSMRSLNKSKSLKSFTVFTPDGGKSSMRFLDSLLDLSMHEIPNGNILPAHSVILSDSDKIHIPVKAETPSKKENCCHKFSCFRLLAKKDVCMSVFLYAIYAFGAIGYEEVYTVWASTIRPLGGLGFDTSEIGKAIGIGAIPLIVVNVVLFPVLEGKLGAKKSFSIACGCLVVLTVLTPCLRFFEEGTTVLWVFVTILSCLTKMATGIAFAAISFFVNNSALPQDIGKVNGIGMVFTATGRFLAPLAGGSVFAWSISHGLYIGFPFDVNCAFIMFGLAYLGSNILAALLPDSVDKQKKDQGN